MKITSNLTLLWIMLVIIGLSSSGMVLGPFGLQSPEVPGAMGKDYQGHLDSVPLHIIT